MNFNFHENSYDLHFKPITADRIVSMQFGQIEQQTYADRMTVERLSYRPYKIAAVKIANTYDSRTISYDSCTSLYGSHASSPYLLQFSYEFVLLPYDFVRLSYKFVRQTCEAP